MSQPLFKSDPRRELAQRLLSGGGIWTAPAIPRRENGSVIPMTAEQRQVWLHIARMPDRPIYNEPITIGYSGAFNHDVFLRSFDELLRRHEALRTSFSSLDEDPVQIVHEDIRAEFPLVDLTGLSADARETQANALAEEDARTPLPLDRAPLFRGRIIRLADDDHRFYLTLHHIIFDGTTLQTIVMPELAAIYEAAMRGDPHDLPSASAQYGDYAGWQQSNPRDHREQLDFWRTTLSGELPAAVSPTDRSPPLHPTSKGEQFVSRIDPEMSETLKLLSRRLGVTPYIALLTIFKTMLHRYGGQNDLVIGSITDTRRHPDLRSMAGYCLNSIALRSRPEPTARFVDYLLQVRDVVAHAIGNSDVPFDEVVRAISRTRHDPIFRTMFSMQPAPRPYGPGWRMNQMEVYPDAAKFDLYVELRDDIDHGFEMRLMYASDLFDRETIVRMAGHFKTLARSVLADETQLLGDLPMLVDEERDDIIAASFGPAHDIPDATIPELVRSACLRDPDRVAVLWEGSAWTGAELCARIDAFAVHLKRFGVRPGEIVAVCMSRCPDMVAAALAIMSAGATYLPLDPSFPSARLTAIVADAKPALIITQKTIAGELPGWGIPVLLRDAPGSSDMPAPPAPVADPEGVAYVMYTSGSTGVPKGVEIRHRSAVNLLLSMAREPGFEPGDTLLAVTTPTFDISILELFLPLVVGGRVAIASNAEIAEPVRLAETIAHSRCTVMQATPATWRSLFATGWTGVPDLRILCGGEALPRDLAERILACGMQLWNVYGPTETTIWSSLLSVTSDRRISIGRPIGNTSMKVLDSRGRLQPFNVPGDLYIGGAGLARGYRDPALTARAFVELPAFPGERLYRTGDVALLRRDGTFEWLGRSDGQVKVRGHRIDLGDIETALASHPAVLSAAVKTFEEQPGQHALAAYVVARAPAPLAAALRDHLKTQLPSYMVPARYITLDDMPLSTSGKIDRKALPDPSAGTKAPAPTPPVGHTEIQLAEIWREILAVDEIGADDDFQDLGGHSLLAAKLMGRIDRAFGRRLPLSTLLHAPTLREMAKLLEPDAPPVTPVDIVTLRDGPSTPLFWIDAVPNFRRGQYRDLIRSLDTRRPFLGLPVNLTLHGDLSDVPDLAVLATDIADAIERYPWTGPRVLGGWCNGAVLAVEVASQLHARGSPIDLLVLLDAANPLTYRRRITRMIHQAIQASRLPAGERWPFVRDLMAAYVARFRRRSALMHADEDALEELNQRFMRLVNTYVPPVYPGKVLLLQPREGRIDYEKGWEASLPDLATAEIAGGHVTMLDSRHAASLAAAIEHAIGKMAELPVPMRA
ncbi:non-ribosomal peptide synthetase [Sphingomonas oryzagri]